MSPTLFNNIYKGALGEVVGRYLFWSVLKLKMEEISEPELFELFDYKVRNLPVYVDFKNWHETTVFNDEEMLNKIEDKANEMEKEGYQLLTFSIITTAKAILIFKK